MPNLALSLCLALLLDGSLSLSGDQWAEAVEAHARGLESPRVVATIERDGIAVAATAFAGWPHDLIGWRVLRSAADARAYAAELRTHAPARRFPSGDGTGTGHALRHAFLASLMLGLDKVLVCWLADAEPAP